MRRAKHCIQSEWSESDCQVGGWGLLELTPYCHYFCRISLATNRDRLNTLTQLTQLTNILSTMFATAVFVDYTILYYVHQSIFNVKAFTTNNKSKDVELLSIRT